MGSLSNLYISQSYQSLIHLATNNTASATLIGLEDGLGNSIGVSVNTAGNLYLSGTFSASLQEGYIYVGNSSGRTIAFPTSSFISELETGSLLTTASFNAYTASTNIRLSNIEITTASILVSISNLNASSASQQVSINALNVFTQSANTRLNNLETTSASVNTSITNINAYTQSNDAKWQDLGSKSGSWITESETGSFARYDISNPWSANQTFTNITAVSASFTYVQTVFETASVIYSSGSNQFGDELTDVQTLSGSVKIRGGLLINNLDVTGSINNINSFTSSAAISINNLNQFTASQSTASIVTSINNLNSFTQSANIRLNNLESTSASVNTSITNINSTTASLLIETSNLETFSASALISISNLNQSSASQQISINALNAATASYVTETESGSFLITASFDNGTRNLTFTKGNNTTFAVNIPDVSGSAGDFVTTSSFNAYTQSNDQRVSSLESNSASVNISIANLNAYTASDDTSISNLEAFTASAAVSISNLNQSSASQQISIDALNVFTASQSTASLVTSIDNLNTFSASALTSLSNINTFTSSANQRLGSLEAATSSYVTETESGSFLITASFASQTLTFTKGDGTTFGLLIPDISGSTIDTGSFVTTSSFNAYTSSNNQRVSSLEANTASVNTSISNINSFTQSANISISALNSATASYVTEVESGSFLITASFDNGTRNLTFTKGDTTTFAVNIPDVSGSTFDTGSFVTTSSFNAYTSSTNNRLTNIEAATASLLIETANLELFTASANSRLNNIESTTASLLIETQNLELFTSSQAQLNGTFATTGSNTFRGNQTLISSSINLQGNGQISFPNGFSLSGNASDIAQLSSATTIQFITEPPAGPGGVNDIKFINRVSGSSIVFQNSQGGAGNSISFEGGSTLFDLNIVSGSTGKLLINADGGIDATNSTFTASLQSGFVWIGNASNVSTATQLSSLSLFSNPNLNSHSSSLYLIANTFNSGAANFAHISSSAQNQANLIFKNNNNTGTTQVSGSNNIFVNPAAPGTGRVNYIGGSSNVFLNSANQVLPTITGSAASVSGNRPTMNGNLLLGGHGLTINQAANPGTHTYNNNIISGIGTHLFNLSGNTGTVTFSQNFNLGGGYTLNSPSRSIAEINAGASGSNSISISNNALNGGSVTYNGPVSSSVHTISNNFINGGTLTLNMQSSSRAITVGGNTLPGAITLNDNTVFAPTLGSNNQITANIVNGVATLNQRFSGSIILANNNINVWTISSDADLSGISTVAQRSVQVGGNALFGTTGNNIYFSGSALGTLVKPFASNLMSGNNLSASVIFSGGGEQALLATAVLGHGLSVFGTSQFNASAGTAVGGQNVGAAFVGRWNATNGNRAGTAETIFAVGTGTSGSTGIVRKTGFLIDSGSNTFVEGTLNVSGSTTFTGSLFIQSGSTLPASTGSAILTWNAATGQVNQASFSTIVSASVSSAEFWSTTTQSGSAGVSGSIQFNNSGSFYNVSLVSGTRLTVANAGVYNIQFSAQIETSAGADTVYIWFKKNGTNIGDSASKAVLANNTAQIMTVNILDEAVANDYYEIAYQTLNGNATVLAEVASGNIPAIPSVITTIIQVR